MKAVLSRIPHFAVLGSVLICSACDKKEKPAPPAKPPVAEARWQVDESLQAQLQAIGKECEVDTKQSSVKCGDSRDKTLVRELVSNKYKRTKALETFVSELEKTDEKAKIVAASILYDATRGGLEEGAAPGSVSKKVAEGLRKEMLATSPQIARQIAPAATYASALAGDLEGLYKSLEGKTSEAASAYRFVMTYGRLDAFQQVQELVKSSNSGIRLAALEAPRNMRRWTPKDRAAICPWAKSLIDDQRPMVGSRAAALLTHCSGEFVDDLLERGKKALADDKFTRGDIPPYRDLCSGMRGREGGGGSKEQCKANRDFLTKVVDEKKLDDQTRALALSAVAYQWPDAETAKLAERYAKSPGESPLKEQAAGTAARLNLRLEAEKKGGEKVSAKVGGLAPPDQAPTGN